MRWIPNFILYYIFLSLGLGLIALAVLVARNNNITKVNAVKREARKAYLSADYNKAFHELVFLVDTLKFSRDEAKLNLAHSGYLAARRDSSNNAARDAMKNGAPVDTAGLNKMAGEVTYTTGLQYYDAVSESRNLRLASLAFNQKGVSAYKLRNVEEPDREEQILIEAADYFKAALKKDPANDNARYNYELLKSKIQFPEKVMAKVQTLIHQRRYSEARRILRKALERDNHMQKNYSDYVQRLENVISIDSLSRS